MIMSQQESRFHFRFYNNKRTRKLSMLATIFQCVVVACYSTHFPNVRRCKWDLNNFFSNGIVLTSCLCLHEATRFMTFKEFYYIFSNWYYISIQLLSATKSSIRELEEIKSTEFSADVVWVLHTGTLCRFTMTSCWKTIY